MLGRTLEQIKPGIGDQKYDGDMPTQSEIQAFAKARGIPLHIPKEERAARLPEKVAENTKIDANRHVVVVYTDKDLNCRAYYDESQIIRIWDEYIKAKGLRYYCGGNGSEYQASLYSQEKLDIDAGILCCDTELYQTHDLDTKEVITLSICSIVDYAVSSNPSIRYNPVTDHLQHALEQIFKWNSTRGARKQIKSHLILFAYHANLFHWNLGVLKLKFDARSELSDAYILAYDPFGGGEIPEHVLQEINKLKAFWDIKVVSKKHHTIKQQYDPVSCGVISAENGKDFIDGHIQRLHLQYPPGAQTLRLQHLNEAQSPIFAKRQRENPQYSARGDKEVQDAGAVEQILTSFIVEKLGSNEQKLVTIFNMMVRFKGEDDSFDTKSFDERIAVLLDAMQHNSLSETEKSEVEILCTAENPGIEVLEGFFHNSDKASVLDQSFKYVLIGYQAELTARNVGDSNVFDTLFQRANNRIKYRDGSKQLLERIIKRVVREREAFESEPVKDEKIEIFLKYHVFATCPIRIIPVGRNFHMRGAQLDITWMIERMTWELTEEQGNLKKYINTFVSSLHVLESLVEELLGEKRGYISDRLMDILVGAIRRYEQDKEKEVSQGQNLKFSAGSSSLGSTIDKAAHDGFTQIEGCGFSEHLIRYQNTIQLLDEKIQAIVALNFFKAQYENCCNDILLSPKRDEEKASLYLLNQLKERHHIFLKLGKHPLPCLSLEEEIMAGQGSAIFIVRHSNNDYSVHFSHEGKHCKVNLIKQYNQKLVAKLYKLYQQGRFHGSVSEAVYTSLVNHDLIYKKRSSSNPLSLYPCNANDGPGCFKTFIQRRDRAIEESLVLFKQAWIDKEQLMNVLDQIELKIQAFYERHQFSPKAACYEKIHKIVFETCKKISLFPGEGDWVRKQSLGNEIKNILKIYSQCVYDLLSLLAETDELKTQCFILNFAMEFQKAVHNQSELAKLERLKAVLEDKKEAAVIGEALLEIDLRIGFQWFKKEADRGDKFAQYRLNSFAKNCPNILSENLPLIFYYYTLSVNKNSIDATYAIAQYYSANLEKNNQNFIEAILWHQKTLDLEPAGDYRIEIEKSFKALERQLADNDNDGKLMFEVGALYQEGKKIIANLEKGIEWYEKAIQRMHLPEGYTTLWHLYVQNGDYQKACHLSLEKNDELGKAEIEILKENMSGVQLYDLGYICEQVYEKECQQKKIKASDSKHYFTAIVLYVEALSKGCLDANLGLERLHEIEDLTLLFKLSHFYLGKNEIASAVKCFIKVAQSNSEYQQEAANILVNMVGKLEYRSGQALLGAFYKQKKDFEKAMICYKTASRDPQIEEPVLISPWNIKDDESDNSSEDSDEAVQTVFEIITQPYVPLIRQHEIPMFYQREIQFELLPYQVQGIYSGTLNGDGLPHGLGTFKFHDSKNKHEILYRGNWEQGAWHRRGDFREIFSLGTIKISIQLTDGNFQREGNRMKLLPEDGCCNAHVMISHKDVQLHYYGAMRSAQRNQFLGNGLECLEKSVCAREFYFDGGGARNNFFSVGQIEVTQKQNTYTLVGRWVFEEKQRFMDLIRDDFKDKKSTCIADIKQMVRTYILRCEEHARYKIFGFLKIAEMQKSNISLLKFVNILLKEENESIYPIIFKNLLLNLREAITLSAEVKELIMIEAHDECVAQIKEIMTNYVQTEYLKFLQKKDEYDAELIKQFSLSHLLWIDPNILEMIFEVRQHISLYWNLNPKFNFVRAVDREEKELDELKNIFIKCWGAYFQVDSSENLEGLYHLIQYNGNKKVYENRSPGYPGFVERVEEIKVACQLYTRYFKYATEILDSLERVQDKEDASFITRFYKHYCETVLNHSFHLENIENTRLVNYTEKYRDVIKVMAEEFIQIFQKCVSNKAILENIRQFFVPPSPLEDDFKMGHVLTSIEYGFFIKNCIETQNIAEIEEIIALQLSVLFRLRDLKYDNFDKVRHLFLRFRVFLENYQVTKLNSILFNKNTLSQILSHHKDFLKYLLALNAADVHEDMIISLCDFVEIQSVLLKIVQRLPLFADSEKIKGLLAANQVEIEAQKQGICKISGAALLNFIALMEKNNVEIRHYSYEILDESLGVFSGFLKENSVEGQWTVGEQCIIGIKYYDVLVALTHQFEKQISCQKLDVYKDNKIQYFKGLEKMKVEDLIKYFCILKKIISGEEASLEIKTPDLIIDEFLNLNRTSNLSSKAQFLNLYKKYADKFGDFRKLYTIAPDANTKAVTLSDIAVHLQNIANLDQDKKIEQEVHEVFQLNSPKGYPAIKYQQGNIQENMLTLLAGLSWILTASVSYLDSRDGQYNPHFKFELTPHVIQILGCIQLLNLDKLSGKHVSIHTHLSNIPKQIGQVLAGQGKSWQISLLSMMYAVFDYEVIVVCCSDYLSNRDLRNFQSYFAVMKEKMRNVKFKTFEVLASDQIEGKQFKEEEQIGAMVEQILYRGKYSGTAYSDERAGDTKQIFIFDEVDTLISRELNKSLNRIRLVESQKLADAMEKLYDAAKKSELTLDSPVMENFEIEAGLEEAFKKNKLLLGQYKEELIYSANLVAGYYSDEPTRKTGAIQLLSHHVMPQIKFRLNSDGTYWEHYVRDEWCSHAFSAYYNAFFYLELLSQTPRLQSNKNYSAYGYLKLKCGELRYSSVMRDMTKKLLLGVSGTIKEVDQGQLLLVPQEEAILGSELLGFEPPAITSFPSLYKKVSIHLESDQEGFFNIVETEAAWLNAIYQLCCNLSMAGKAVLVFFKNEDHLNEIFRRLAERQPYQLTNDFILVDQHGVRRQNGGGYRKQELGAAWQLSIDKLVNDLSGKAGQITLSMASYGYGSDFQDKHLNETGGLHVIQSWFSEDLKEETQIKGRTTRNGSLGTYMQLLCLAHLKRGTFYDSAAATQVTLATSYSALRLLAQASLQKKYEAAKKEIEQHEHESGLVLTWLNNAKMDRAKKLRAHQPTVIEDSIVPSYNSCIDNFTTNKRLEETYESVGSGTKKPAASRSAPNPFVSAGFNFSA